VKRPRKKRAPGDVVRQARRYAARTAAEFRTVRLVHETGFVSCDVESLLDAAYRAGYLACLRDRKKL
jgi:hypothetical protein